MTSDIKRIDIDMRELETILERAREGSLDEEDIRKLKAALETLGLLTELLGDKDTTINRLRKFLFGAGTERISHVLGNAPGTADSAKDNKTDEAKAQT
jgi:hypothetical protein